MADESSETPRQEPQKPPESNELQLNQTIYPFESNYKTDTHESQDREPTYMAERTLLLPTENGELRLPVEFWLSESPTDGLDIVPFHPDGGYTITQEDFTLESRRAKLERHMHEPWFDANYPMSLTIFITPEGLQEAGIITLDEERFRAKPGPNAHVLDQLRCIVQANGSYLSRGDQELPKRVATEYTFGNFFPFDAPPLARDDSGQTQYLVDGLNDQLFVGEGHGLRFSTSMVENSKIGISFVRARQPKGE